MFSSSLCKPYWGREIDARLRNQGFAGLPAPNIITDILHHHGLIVGGIEKTKAEACHYFEHTCPDFKNRNLSRTMLLRFHSSLAHNEDFRAFFQSILHGFVLLSIASAFILFFKLS